MKNKFITTTSAIPDSLGTSTTRFHGLTKNTLLKLLADSTRFPGVSLNNNVAVLRLQHILISKNNSYNIEKPLIYESQ